MLQNIRAARFVPIALAAALFTAACGDDPVEHEDEPEVAVMRLNLGGQTVDVAENGTVTGGPILLVANTNVPITATFLRANGSVESLVTASEFRLDVTPAAGTVTFTRISAFAGTLRATATGTSQVSVSLVHVEENHADFGPFNVTVLVQ